MQTFSYCTSLESVTLPNKLVSIESYAFSSCTSLTSITLPENLRWIREFAFYDCSSLKEIYIPKNIMGIETMAFGGLESGIEKITVDKNNLYYSSDSFGVLFDKDKTTVYQYPVASKNTSYSIPDSVTIICEYAFAFNKNLSTINIPDSVAYISDFAFAGLSDVSEISIPDSVYYVGHLAFSIDYNSDKTLNVHIDNTRLYVLKNWNKYWMDDNINVSFRFF